MYSDKKDKYITGFLFYVQTLNFKFCIGVWLINNEW